MVRTVTTLSLVFLMGIPALAGQVRADGLGPEDRVLRFDESTPRIEAPRFKRDEDLEPDDNDFQIIDTSYMSNNLGERWAVVTLRNTSTGQRLFRKQDIVATFADGSQSYAVEGEETFKGRETITLTVFFGIRRFPIVDVTVE